MSTADGSLARYRGGVTGFFGQTNEATGGGASGAAGGDLAGTYPNPTLAVIGAASGPVGGATSSAVVAIDAKGRVSSLSSVPISGVPPSGVAGGALAGTYPNPSLATAFLPLAGGTLTGPLSLNGVNRINAVSNGLIASDAVTLGQLPTTLPPSGAAGGDLTGTYPNPSLVAVAVPTGPVGGTTVTPVVSIDAAGRTLSLSSAFIRFSRVDVFTVVGASTWTCPAGVTLVQVWGQGGGGGGGGGGGACGGSTTAGGGGGGGGHSGGASFLSMRWVDVVPTTVYAITVGAGGAGGGGGPGGVAAGAFSAGFTGAAAFNGGVTRFGSLTSWPGGGFGAGGNGASSGSGAVAASLALSGVCFGAVVTGTGAPGGTAPAAGGAPGASLYIRTAETNAATPSGTGGGVGGGGGGGCGSRGDYLYDSAVPSPATGGNGGAAGASGSNAVAALPAPAGNYGMPGLGGAGGGGGGLLAVTGTSGGNGSAGSAGIGGRLIVIY